MKTPMQELIELITLKENKEDGYIILKPSIGTCKFQALLDKEKEFVTNFAMDYVFSGEVGCAMWGDGPPELDIDKNARDYYKEYINTTSLDSTEWSNTKEK